MAGAGPGEGPGGTGPSPSTSERRPPLFGGPPGSHQTVQGESVRFEDRPACPGPNQSALASRTEFPKSLSLRVLGTSPIPCSLFPPLSQLWHARCRATNRRLQLQHMSKSSDDGTPKESPAPLSLSLIGKLRRYPPGALLGLAVAAAVHVGSPALRPKG